MGEAERARVGAVLSATGRALAALLFLFWWVLFAVHLYDGITGRVGAARPLEVWSAITLHLLMVLGLALLVLRREVPGALLTVGATVTLFVVLDVKVFPWLGIMNAAPLPFLAAARLLRRSRPPAAPAGALAAPPP